MQDESGNDPEVQDIPAEETVGERLRILRLNRCLSLKKLAKLSNLSINTLSLIENNKSSPAVATLQQLAKARNNYQRTKNENRSHY